jgi:hypothetical protein
MILSCKNSNHIIIADNDSTVKRDLGGFFGFLAKKGPWLAPWPQF